MNRNLFFSCVLFFALFACKTNTENSTSQTEEAETPASTADPFFDLSLAQWSLHKPIFDGEMDPLDFPKVASELGFSGVEYVSTLYNSFRDEYDDEQEGMQALVDSLNARTDKNDIRSVLIMVDGEGPLAADTEEERNSAVDNHKKWVDAAADLGCHSIRVNLSGTNEKEAWKENSMDGLTKLAEYASGKNINIIVENHGGFSSDAAFLMEVINGVDMENCGTLPDFGNFCLAGGRVGPDCDDEYDVYKGVKEMMPKAKGVSAKSYEFENGEETTLNYQRLLKIVKDAGYEGFIGVEYEGDLENPKEGIKLTRDLLLSSAKEID